MGAGNFRSLTLGNTAAKMSRKYLGDATDPHFVPKSPLIERRRFSAQAEDELTRSCTNALADVPHSDGDLDDPFRYLASQITVRQDQPQQRGDTKDATQVMSHALTVVSTGAQTATPSETSKRETLQTNDTTPWTTPGVTPAETGSRFSDVGKRPITAQPSNLRSESKPAKAHILYSFLNEPVPTRPSLIAAASRSMTNLPILSKDRSKDQSNMMKKTSDNPTGRPDFNKSLPAIPKFSAEQLEGGELPKEKVRGISRMLKTVRIQKTQKPPIVAPRSTSTDFSSKQKDLLERTATKKHKFNPFAFLQKRTSTNTKRATVG